MSRTDSKTDVGRGFSPADAGLKARATAVGSGSEPTGNLDALIDEALDDLTAGAPREGFRGRVMARITSTPEPTQIPVSRSSAGGYGRSRRHRRGGRARPHRRAGDSVVGPSRRSKAREDRNRRARAEHRVAACGRPRPAQRACTTGAGAAIACTRPAASCGSPASGKRVPDTCRCEDTSMFPSVTVDPLSDPRPIVNHAIEIKPLRSSRWPFRRSRYRLWKPAAQAK